MTQSAKFQLIKSSSQNDQYLPILNETQSSNPQQKYLYQNKDPLLTEPTMNSKNENVSLNDEILIKKEGNVLENYMEHNEEYEEYEEEGLSGCEDENSEALMATATTNTTATNSACQSLSSSVNSNNGYFTNDQNLVINRINYQDNNNTTPMDLKPISNLILNEKDWGIELIRVPDISPTAFNIMIDYIYTNFDSRKSVALNEDNVMHTLYAG